jgi:hypothetical protein
MDLVGAELFRAPVRRDESIYRRTDGRTNMTNKIVAFRNFAKAPKNEEHTLSYTFLLTISNFFIAYFQTHS